MELTEESLARSHFSPENPTIIVAHGWNSNGRWRGYGASLADDYLAEGDYNVFSVDWGDLESWANYPHAAAVTRPVGEFAAELGMAATLAHCAVTNSASKSCIRIASEGS